VNSSVGSTLTTFNNGPANSNNGLAAIDNGPTNSKNSFIVLKNSNDFTKILKKFPSQSTIFLP
jgi:hypothetical protein